MRKLLKTHKNETACKKLEWQGVVTSTRGKNAKLTEQLNILLIAYKAEMKRRETVDNDANTKLHEQLEFQKKTSSEELNRLQVELDSQKKTSSEELNQLQTQLDSQQMTSSEELDQLRKENNALKIELNEAYINAQVC